MHAVKAPTAAGHLIAHWCWLAEGVSHLHALGISHRDLKPENIFYKDPSQTAQIMILDFNLAKESNRPTWGADTPLWDLSIHGPRSAATPHLQSGKLAALHCCRA